MLWQWTCGERIRIQPVPAPKHSNTLSGHIGFICLFLEKAIAWHTSFCHFYFYLWSFCFLTPPLAPRFLSSLFSLSLFVPVSPQASTLGNTCHMSKYCDSSWRISDAGRCSDFQGNSGHWHIPILWFLFVNQLRKHHDIILSKVKCNCCLLLYNYHTPVWVSWSLSGLKSLHSHQQAFTGHLPGWVISTDG